MNRFAVMLLAIANIGCMDRPGSHGASDRAGGRPPSPEVPPVMLNEETPFRYPSALWAQRVQANVTLRIVIDSTGRPVDDSTTISTPSGIPAFDSAALDGAKKLRFTPARRHDAPVSVVLLLPVFFRHPDAPPLPGDTALSQAKKQPSQ